MVGQTRQELTSATQHYLALLRTVVFFEAWSCGPGAAGSPNGSRCHGRCVRPALAHSHMPSSPSTAHVPPLLSSAYRPTAFGTLDRLGFPVRPTREFPTPVPVAALRSDAGPELRSSPYREYQCEVHSAPCSPHRVPSQIPLPLDEDDPGS